LAIDTFILFIEAASRTRLF